MVTLSNVGADVEKDIVPEVNDASKRDSDNASADFQPGVKRVRAVASVWSKKTLWLTFAL